MNLTQMSDFITTEIGVYDAESRRLAKSFLDKEYRVLWDKYPWSDTQDVATVIVPAGVNTVDYPPGIERAVTIRAISITSNGNSDARFLDPINSTFLVETDPAIFERSGFVQYYEENADLTTGIKRLRVYPTPLLDTTLFIVGKAPCPGFSPSDNTATSKIRNIDNALIAYAYFDFLQRQRQYAKAKEKLAEANQLEQNAWTLEQQQANQPRRTKATTVAGNTLAEMTDAVCAICGQWTPDYRLIIREFLRRNYQSLYDLFLWPESVLAVRVPYTTEQVIMPPYVDKVLGVRGTTDMRMFPADSVLFLDITPTIFEEIGTSIGYTTLTPVAVATLPVNAQQLLLASTSPVDRGKVFIRGEVIATGVEMTEEVTLNGTTFVTSANAYDIPLTIAKDITVGDVTINSADTLSLAVIPADTRELKHQRLWFLPIPNIASLAEGETFTCLVLAKRLNRPLLTDQDTPLITGCQQVLIAAAAGDLFRKLEKNDQAQAMLQKADGSMAALKAKNTDQAASAPRFVPQVEPRAYIAGGVGGCAW